MTLSFIKPDGVKRELIGEIIKRFEGSGLRVVGLKMLYLKKKEAEKFYAVHKDKPFFQDLTRFISSGPIVAMVLEGEDAINKNRQIMGATNPKEAEEGTIRRGYGTSIEQNVVHGSDSKESAIYEIPYFFNNLEIFSY